MALDVNRWFKYAKARVDAAFRSGHEELDEMEAERDAILAERPWLASDGDTPTLDEARARIEWEAQRQSEGAAQPVARGGSSAPVGPDGPKVRGAPGALGADPTSPATAGSELERPTSRTDEPARETAKTLAPPTDPRTGLPLDAAAAADAATAKVELENKRRQTAERLDQIRRELGVDDPKPT